MERLRKRAQDLQIELKDKQLEQFAVYYKMLVDKNKVMNLTAITELDDVITKHFTDSLALVSAYPEIQNQDADISVLDLGTGAGFPGLPLKITFPHLQVTLMDSLNKRVNFLQSVIETLNLCDIAALHGRAEEAAREKEYRESFDLCVSRAVANLSTLSEYCLPFVKTGGYFVSYKSVDIDEEIEGAKKAIQILGGNLTAVKDITLPQSDIQRSFVIIEKISSTPKTYPRKAGTAKKEPIS